MRPRSPATEIRYLRCVLRHARTALAQAADPYQREGCGGLARCVVEMIDRELAPRRGKARRKARLQKPLTLG